MLWCNYIVLFNKISRKNGTCFQLVCSPTCQTLYKTGVEKTSFMCYFHCVLAVILFFPLSALFPWNTTPHPNTHHPQVGRKKATYLNKVMLPHYPTIRLLLLENYSLAYFQGGPAGTVRVTQDLVKSNVCLKDACVFPVLFLCLEWRACV